MRRDMKDIIINTSRHYDGWYPRKSPEVVEVYPYGDDFSDEIVVRVPGKEFRTFERRDRLGPMNDWLESNDGRPWNDVWSELCEHADHRCIRGKHLRDHVDRWVDRASNKRFRRWITNYDVTRYLHVDEDGILRKPREED